jgi:integrase
MTNQFPAAPDPVGKQVEASAPLGGDTERQYLKIVSRMYRESTDRRSTDPVLVASVTDKDVVDDLLRIAPELRPATWRLYRSALRWHLLHLVETLPASRSAALQLALDALNAYAHIQDSKLPPRTSSARRRSLTEDDLGRLINALNSRRASEFNWSLRAAHWLLAGLGTGLRPVEWLDAVLLDDGHLRVRNAKIKGVLGGIPSGDLFDVESESGSVQPEVVQYRIVPVPEEYRVWVRVHLTSLREALDLGVPFKRIYGNCRTAIRRACDDLWAGKKRIALYTARGQFTSNAKAIMPLGQVSLLLGHRTQRTTTRNYGKRRHAHPGFAARHDSERLEHESERATHGANPAAAPEAPAEPAGAYASLARYASET